MKLVSKLLITAAASGLLASAPASAASILGLYNTGVDANGVKLAVGSQDTHYTIGTTQPYVFNNNAYVQPTTAGFISSQPNGGGSGGIFSLVFDLGSLNPATASLSGKAAYDNGVTIFLNGVQLYMDQPGSYSAFQQLNPFTAPSSAFNAGLNTLTFNVTDYGGDSGLLVTDLAGTASGVPEPATWAMMLVGFGMVGAGVRSRRKPTVRLAYS